MDPSLWEDPALFRKWQDCDQRYKRRVSNEREWKVAKKPKVLSRRQIDTILAGKKGLSIIQYHANWCEPCKAQTGQMSKVTTALGKSGVAVIRADVDKMGDLQTKLKMDQVPLITFIKNGKEVSRIVGYHTAEEVAKKACKAFGIKSCPVVR